MTTHAALVGVYDYHLVALSVIIAILAAYAALDLAGCVTAACGGRKSAWLFGGAVAMGSGIWAMHYVGMEALRLPIPVLYDSPTVLLSLLTAILASGVALYLVSQPTLSPVHRMAGSIIMGSGIAAMHYIGMAAMRLPAMCSYNAGLVILSVALAIAISYVALRLTFALKGDRTSWSARKAGGALVMGLAIPVMHYVGMAAVTFFPAATVGGNLHHAVNVSNLSLAGIVLTTFALLALVFVSSSVDRRLANRASQFEGHLTQLREVFSSMTDAIVVVDFKKGIAEHNRAATKLLGLSKEITPLQELAENFVGFLPGGKLLSVEDWPLMRAKRGDFVTGMEILIRKVGTESPLSLEVTTVPIIGSDHKNSRVIISFHDVGKSRMLDETRTRLAAIVESSEDAIIGKNYEGIVTSWNRGAEKIFGYTAEEMLGQPILRLLPPDRKEEETVILGRLRNDEVVEHFETMRVRKDGTEIHVSLTISPIRDSAGNIIGASKIARDITEKRKMERQLQQSQKMDAIGQLTGGVAHDFNNLLGIIIGNLDLLERHVSADAAALQRVQRAQKAALRGADLTRGLLAFSSNETLSPAPTELNALVHSTIDMTRRVIGPEIKIATSLDDAVTPIVVDASGLESALINLLVNARDAMPKGGSITITTHIKSLDEAYPPVQAGELKAGRYACISVSDTGEGMSRQTLERAFEPFFTTKPRGKGTGLGLAMVYGFVKQSQGTVRIYSEPGFGTTVSLYLPLVEDASRFAQPPAETRSPFTEAATVLVVDDELDLLDIATAYLEAMGCKAFTAADGKEALELAARENSIDLLMTDIIMPGGMNGIELAERVRRLHPKIKVIYCSGFPANALAERSMTVMDCPLLDKPYQRDEFSAMVRRVMETPHTGAP